MESRLCIMSKRILETAKNSLAMLPDAARFSAHDASQEAVRNSCSGMTLPPATRGE
jgi:hypothetical protein